MAENNRQFSIDIGDNITCLLLCIVIVSAITYCGTR